MKATLEKEKLARQAQEILLNDLKQEVTKRRQVEEELQEREQQLAQLLEAVPVGIFVIDAQRNPYYANQKAQEILGKGIVTSNNSRPFNEIYQAYKAGSQQIYPLNEFPIIRALQGENITIDDIEILRDNDRIPLEVSATPIFDEKGKIIYAIAAFQDINQRKKQKQNDCALRKN